MTTGDDEPAGGAAATAHGQSHDAPRAAESHGGAAPAHGAAEHGPEAEALGPVDYAAWTAGIIGLGVGLLTAACFALATAPIGR